MSSFPVASKRPHPITLHNQTRIDPYFWMRYKEDPEVLQYLRAENDYLDEMTQHTKPLQEKIFLELKGRMKEDDNSVPEKDGDFYYYTRTEAGKQYPIFCRRRGLDAPEQVMLDQNALVADRGFCRIGAFSVSPDGRKLAYSIDPDGSEICALHIRDLETGSDDPEVVHNTYGDVYDHGGLAWSADGGTLFYMTLDAAQRACRVHRHVLGTDAAQDELLYEEGDERFRLILRNSRSGDYVLVYVSSTTTSEWHFLPAGQPGGAFQVFQPRIKGLEYSIEHHGNIFYVITNENAQNFKLMKTPITATLKENWQEVIAHDPDVYLFGIDPFEKFLVLHERRGGFKQIRISDVDAVSNVRHVQFPEPVYDFEPTKNPEFATTVFRFEYSSLVTPKSVIDFHVESGEWELKKQDEIPSGYDASQYVSERLYAPASNGALVPMSIVYKKGLQKNGQNPCLLYGYGSYGATIDPEFNANRFSLLDRGFVYAIGHIRGGAEMGRAWYENGKMLNKRNTFTDFIACAEHLIAEGYTSKEKIAIQGGSAGGLLVSACLTLRPDLFKAVIAKVPFVDVVTTMNDPSIPLTTLEYDEWGNPENQMYYDYMLGYSPYDSIRATEYPNLLITTGLNDPRVAYWEPAKFAARLRELKTDDNLLLLKTDFNAGHAGASGRYDYLKEIAFDYAFLIDRLGA